MGIEAVQEKNLRKKVASDADSLEHASDLLAHSDLNTTRVHYQPNAAKVKALKHRNNRFESNK